ncbi:hypothetical protein [Flammeovirga sp. SubArs3]|uniref:hypothetical protein n=1 Tax=Flammeovirga sp. SubArs3 TaxID=2995316 RepID=UPI00248B5456|nr:hypothetical protein [Flammeovirga sp. SubArs3]
MSKYLKNLYHYIQALSLDVAIGAIICCKFLAVINGIVLPISVFISLGTAVWVIYTLDHLLDAHSIQHTAHTFRHAFHQRNKKTLGIFCLFFGFIGIANTFLYLPISLFYHGLILTSIVSLYLVIINLKVLPFATFKEFTVAIIYTAGISLPVFSLSPEATPQLYLFTGIFFTLASINLLEFALFDYETDTKDGQLSGTRKLGYNNMKYRINILSFLFILLMGISFYILPTELYSALIVLLLMGSCLGLIYIKSNFFSKDDYFRIFGDFVFLFPAIYLFIS